jgi:hypothetical protein
VSIREAAVREESIVLTVEVGPPEALAGLLAECFAVFAALKEAHPSAIFVLVTVLDLDAAAFAGAWRDAIPDDPRARALLGMCEQADALSGGGPLPYAVASLK